MDTISIFIEQISNILLIYRGRPISDLEVLIIRGIFEEKTYDEISLETTYSTGYICDLGGDILKYLRSHYRYPVKKTNLIYFAHHYLSEKKI